MQRINEDIKTGQLKQVYLLYGEEAYLRKQYKDRLKKALCADGDTMNFHYCEGKDVNVPQIIDLAETLPFLAERRVLLIPPFLYLRRRRSISAVSCIKRRLWPGAAWNSERRMRKRSKSGF